MYKSKYLKTIEQREQDAKPFVEAAPLQKYVVEPSTTCTSPQDLINWYIYTNPQIVEHRS